MEGGRGLLLQLFSHLDERVITCEVCPYGGSVVFETKTGLKPNPCLWIWDHKHSWALLLQHVGAVARKAAAMPHFVWFSNARISKKQDSKDIQRLFIKTVPCCRFIGVFEWRNFPSLLNQKQITIRPIWPRSTYRIEHNAGASCFGPSPGC